MNGAQDMGGVMGFGPVVPEPNEPVFHGDWEKRALAMTVLMGPAGGWNADQGRFAREDVPPLDYLSRTYYEIWFAGLTRLLAERDMVLPDELAAARALHPPKPPARVIKADDVGPMLAKGRPTERALNTATRFKIGDRVRARNIHPTHHTRLPRYVRGHVGTVTHLQGAHVFPDANAQGQGEAPQWLYTVRFSGSELWGDAADPTVTVSVDAWESYLEAVA
jgi:nitrile hydratase subunit beta